MRTSAPGRSGPCPSFLAAMQVLGKRWNGLLIQAIRDQELRFVDVRAMVPGISDGVLAARLAELAHCGLVSRRDQAPGSARGLYALTPKGRDLLPVLDQLTEWSERWLAAGGER